MSDKTDFDLLDNEPSPEITLQMVQSVVTIIDLCTKRGAFEGAELTSVGSIREAFVKVIDFHAQAMQTPIATSNENNSSAEATEET